MYLTSLRTE